jgi:hypothetical protein
VGASKHHLGSGANPAVMNPKQCGFLLAKSAKIRGRVLALVIDI